MKLKIELNMHMDLYHKNTMQLFKLENKVEQEYDDTSEEYKKMCEEYKIEVGFEREGNEDKFDKELLTIITRDTKEVLKERNDQIVSVIRQCYKTKNVTGYIEYGGYIINPCDFCAAHIYPIEVKMSKGN